MEPLSFYESTNSLKFYLIDCDSGLMHLIVFPDETVVLFDCNLTEDNKDRIINLLKRIIPQKDDKQEIDIFVNSHRDRDHLRGLKEINANFKIKSIWDSGLSGANIDNADYKYYMYLKRKLKEENENNVYILVPSNLAIATFGNADIYCFSAEADFEENYVCEAQMSVKKQHTNSIVLSIEYSGRKMLLTGDSDWKCWKEGIVPTFSGYEHNYENTDILIASHHGSRSFFTDEELNENINEEDNPDSTYVESIRLIKPKITLISCGEYSVHHHPNKEALALYKEWTSEEQVYTTHEHGTFCGFIDESGNFGVVPEKVKNTFNVSGKGFEIICSRGSDNKSVGNGEELVVGCSLKFSILSWGNIINSTDKITVVWQVVNAGYGDDSEHHEIYYKGKDEGDGKYHFSRELSYEGTHLLRCRICNLTKGFVQTRIFVVKGKKE